MKTHARPIHKWKTLWLGILILIFLLWAWARSRTHHDAITIRPGTTTYYGAGSSIGRIFLATTDYRSGHMPAKRLDYGSAKFPTAGPWFPEPFVHPRRVDLTRSESFLGIAHWLITLLFILIWLTLLFWRSHRMRRLITSSPQARSAP